MTDMHNLFLLVPLAPLAGAMISGLFCRRIGRTAAHLATILGVAVAFIASLFIFRWVMDGNTFNGTVYTWLTTLSPVGHGGMSHYIHFDVGFLIDPLSAMMMVVVTFVSLMVHVYTIGYMHDDPGYQRFFSYISLFTFSMLMLVMSNNFMQLFFGWEAVGLVSYLLIGFWFTKPSAVYANLKAFMVNRVGDFGFLLGIGMVLMYAGSLDYATVFSKAPDLAKLTVTLIPGHVWSLMSVTCILLFIGAMGKSAQFPLHVWLPDSMEGPTPISALIHAATMVTAGIFMVARMSPLFELSPTARSFVIVIGGITALFMAFLGVIQYDIKRVVAYSTLSQLGYMTTALGASAYQVAVFHLMTHAFFKALLFLAAGSVIIAMHHEQDMRKMGGLKKYMPITYWTTVIGGLALSGIPPFAGFFSKDSIIEAVGLAQVPGAGFAYFAVVAGVFVTAFYTFRQLFMTFHGAPRMDHHTLEHVHESPWVVTVPLIALAIPSLLAGWFYIEPMLFGNFFGNAIYVAPANNVLAELGHEWHGQVAMIVHSLTSPVLWLALAGIVSAWYCYLVNPALPARIKEASGPIYAILERKYGFDEFNEWFFAGGLRRLGTLLWRIGDVRLIDGIMVNGTARAIGWWSTIVRKAQSGYIYHYAFAMILGAFLLLSWFARS